MRLCIGMRFEPRTLLPSSAAGRREILTGKLTDVLRSEERLLQELAGVLTDQKEALLASDSGAVEESVHSIHRLLHTLAAARDRRRSLSRYLGQSEDLPIARLIDALGATQDSDLSLACGRLAEVTREVGARLEDTREALRRASTG